MVRTIETVVVGGGQAGLITSYLLKQQGREHIVLEAADKPIDRWRNHVWQSFTWVTPNALTRIPGVDTSDLDPDGFMTRDEIVSLFDTYHEQHELPVRCGVRVESVERQGDHYRLQTSEGEYIARNVVIATGAFQQPKRPAVTSKLPEEIVQLHSSEFQSPESLTPGAVLVVGSGQSGAQIAEELYQSGRKVYLSVSSVLRLPRRYRGKDATFWMLKSGFAERTVDQLDDPRERFKPNPLFSGKDGQRILNLHRFARDGVTLLGRVTDFRDGALILAADLHENLAKADAAEVEFCLNVDRAIEKMGLTVPPETLPQLTDGFQQPEIRALDLEQAGITSVIWATGYTFDYSLVRLPVTDEYGYPRAVQHEDFPGLYFVGMPFVPTFKAGVAYGVGDVAQEAVSAIAARA